MSVTLVVLGPTAVGKTQLSLDLALKFSGEVINADAMQLYRGMEIGTAKISAAQRLNVPHHLFEALDVRESANVADYQEQSRRLIAQIIARNNLPILVGGSGLFIQACLDEFEFPGHDEALRSQLENELAAHGPQFLHERLTRLAPEAAEHILPSNGRRIVRALEVISITGRAPVTKLGELQEVIPAIRIGLTRTREDLDQRINQRVELMWENGLEAEVKELIGGGLLDSRTARAAIGYKQAIAYLSGEISRDAAIEQTKASTRRYVRRQQSWFARDTRISWFDAQADNLADGVISHIQNHPLWQRH